MIFKEVDKKDFYHLQTHMDECEKGVIYGTQYPHGYEILDGTIEYASRQFVNEDVAKAYVAEHYEGIEIKSQMNLFDVCEVNI